MAEYLGHSAAAVAALAAPTQQQQNLLQQQQLLHQQQQYVAAMQQQQMVGSGGIGANLSQHTMRQMQQSHHSSINNTATTITNNSNPMAATVSAAQAVASAAAMQQQAEASHALLIQQKQQLQPTQLNFSIPQQTSSPILQQGMMQQQRNSPHLLQQQTQQQRQMGMSPQMIQRATPSPVVVGQQQQRRTSPGQPHHIVVQQQQQQHQQQSSLVQNGSNVSGKPPQFIQFARPGPSMYSQQQQLHVSHSSQPVQIVQSVHSQQQQIQAQPQVHLQQQHPMTMYRQVVTQQPQVQQQTQMRYAYIQTSDGAMSVPVQQQNINENRPVQVFSQQGQPMQIRYSNPQTSQQISQQQISQQPTLRQVLTNPETNIMSPQQQQIVSSASGLQQQHQQPRNVILLPSGQPATIIRANSIPVDTPRTTIGGQTILISSASGIPQTSSQQSNTVVNSGMGSAVSSNIAATSIQVSSSTNEIMETQQMYQPVSIIQGNVPQSTIMIGGASNQQYYTTTSVSNNTPSTNRSSLPLTRNNSAMSITSDSSVNGYSSTIGKSNSPNKGGIQSKVTSSASRSSASFTTKSFNNAVKPMNSGLATSDLNTTLINTSIAFSDEPVILETANKSNAAALAIAAKQTSFLERVDLDALLKSVDEYSTLEDEAAAAILQLTDDFVNEIVNGVIKLSNHRESKRIGTNDVRYFLKSRFNVALLPDPKDAGAKILGSNTNSSTDVCAPKRRALAVHDQRLALIGRVLKKM